MTEIEMLAQFRIDVLISLGFGFGCIFWVLVLWIIFGKR